MGYSASSLAVEPDGSIRSSIDPLGDAGCELGGSEADSGGGAEVLVPGVSLDGPGGESVEASSWKSAFIGR